MSATPAKHNSNQTRMAKGPREGSVMWAVIEVLSGKRKPMAPAEILAEIRERKLATRLNGKTPEATAARLAVHAKQGR